MTSPALLMQGSSSYWGPYISVNYTSASATKSLVRGCLEDKGVNWIVTVAAGCLLVGTAANIAAAPPSAVNNAPMAMAAGSW